MTDRRSPDRALEGSFVAEIASTNRRLVNDVNAYALGVQAYVAGWLMLQNPFSVDDQRETEARVAWQEGYLEAKKMDITRSRPRLDRDQIVAVAGLAIMLVVLPAMGVSGWL